MEKTAYEISEGVPVIEICVIVHSPVSKCPVEFPFDIRLTTNDNTASMFYGLLMQICMHNCVYAGALMYA